MRTAQLGASVAACWLGSWPDAPAAPHSQCRSQCGLQSLTPSRSASVTQGLCFPYLRCCVSFFLYCCCPADGHDSSSVDFDSDSEHPEYIDATTSIREYDLEAPRSDHAGSFTSSSPGSESPGPGVSTGASKGSSNLAGRSKSSEAGPGSRTLQALLSWRHRGNNTGLHEPLLVAIDESPANSRDGQAGSDGACLSYEANSSGDTVPGRRGRTRAAQAAEAAVRAVDRERELSLAAMLEPGMAAAAAAAAHQQQQGTQTDHSSQQGDQPVLQRQSSNSATQGSSNGSRGGLPPPAFARLAGPDMQGLPPIIARGLAHAQQSPGNPASSRGFGAHGRRTFTEGSLRGSSLSPVAPQDRAETGINGWSPRAASDSGVPPALGYSLSFGNTNSPRLLAPSGYSLVLPHSPLTPRTRRLSDGGWVHGETPDGPLSPHLQELHQQHFAEQVELLEQQAAEHDALLAAHEEQQEVLKAGGMTFKHRLQYPFVQLLSCTMPRVSFAVGLGVSSAVALAAGVQHACKWFC